MEYYDYLLTVRDNIKQHHHNNLSHIDEFLTKYEPKLSNSDKPKPKLKLIKPIIKITEIEEYKKNDGQHDMTLKKSIKFDKFISNKLTSCKEIREEKLPQYKSMKLEYPDNLPIRIIL